MKRTSPVGAVVAAVVLFGACDETSPTAADPGLLPVVPTTIEVRFPFADFGRDVRLTSGFGRVANLNSAIVASRFEEALDARTLVRFAPYPQAVSVANATGVVVTDSVLTFVGGRVVVRVDTTTAKSDGPVVLIAGQLRAGPWDPRSATWVSGVDTVAHRVPWVEAGAGPVTILDTVLWDPTASDTVVFTVDSATVNAWADTTDASRGLRLHTATDGTRLELTSVLLSVDLVPSVRPDTILERPVGILNQGFVYDPPPPPPGGEFRVGGAPSWRSTFAIELPDSLTGPPELCDAFGCPFELTSESVNFAALTLTSAPSPRGFQPDDSLTLDVRAVLSEPNLPKSPLGNSLAGQLGLRLPPSYFNGETRGSVTVGVTGFVQDLLRGETLAGDPAPRSVSLLTFLEPLSLEILTFEGPGEAAPVLRMILTTRVGVPLR